MKRSRTLGFTLLELLVVVIIVGILATVALPQFGRMIRRSRVAEAENIIGAVLTAELLYYQENNVFTAAYADLLVSTPTSANYTFAAPVVGGTAVHVVATGTGAAAGITVTGTTTNEGRRTFTRTGA